MIRVVVLLSLTCSCVALSQMIAPGITIANADAKTPKLPRYLVYRHFLNYIDNLDQQASSGTADPDAFAKALSHRFPLRDSDLDLLRNHAHELKTQLKQHDGKASPLIQAYRAKAKAALQAGRSLPPLPAQLHTLQIERTALLVDRFVKLRKALGPGKTSSLDAYLDREFVPHLSMKSLAIPNSPARLSTAKSLQ